MNYKTENMVPYPIHRYADTLRLDKHQSFNPIIHTPEDEKRINGQRREKRQRDKTRAASTYRTRRSALYE